MDQPDKLTVTITGDHADKIRESVARGEFESPEHFVAAAIETSGFAGPDDLPDWLPDIDTLRREIEEAINDPRPPLTSEQVRQHLDQLVAETKEKALRTRTG